jgi:LacI family transcriptional regulator/LacI family purine nucleotide synthesis repressor
MCHREIGFWKTDEPSGPRLKGFEKAMRESKVKVRREWLFGGGPGSYLHNEDSGIEFAHKFQRLSRRPTAMCMVNDRATHAFVAALSRAGLRVPEDLSVVSHDDTPIARCGFLPLTTMSHPDKAIGQAVVDLLQKRLNGELDETPQQVVVRGELIVRESTSFALPL